MMKKILSIILIISPIFGYGQTAQDYYNQGNDKAKAQDFAVSIREYDKALMLDPNYTDAYYNRGIVKIYIRDFKGALADFNKAVELRPDFINGIINRGVAKLNLSDEKGALRDFDAALRLDSNNSLAYSMRGQVKIQLKDLDGGCRDLIKAKELGNSKADQILKQYCGKQLKSNLENKTVESLTIDWPDTEGWRIASSQDNAQQTMTELLRNKESFENWTEIGTMIIYKGLSAAKEIPVSNTMNFMYESAKKSCPSAKLTLIETGETAKYPWIIFKIECGSPDGTESQVWYAVQGTNDLFVNFRAVKQKTVPADLEEKWVKFFKAAKMVTR